MLHSAFGTAALRRCYATQLLNHYQVLELQPHASLKDIKTQFKKLSKMYHPDLNAHLGDADKEANSKKYVQMVLAYDTLKDAKKKRAYDATLKASSGGTARRDVGQNKYYGEAKYYSRANASGSYTSSGYNYTRHKVRNFYKGEATSAHFTGHHQNRGDRHDVPHFDYAEHLLKNLKFEQRIINKQLTEEDRESILRQLAKNGDTSKIDEELLTKHLMRQALRSKFNPRPTAQARAAAQQTYIYQPPPSEESSLAVRTAMLLGGAGSIYLLYHMVG